MPGWNHEPTEERAATQRPFGWNQLRYAVAGLLLAAAATKVIDTPRILAGGGLLGTLPRIVFVTAFEAAAAAWIVVGDRFVSWILTLAIFVVFVVSTTWAILTGQSCNCFGDQVDARTMLILDVCVLFLVASFRPVGRRNTSRWLTAHLVIAVAVGGAFAGLSIWNDQTTDRTDPLEFLLAHMLTGKPWPLDEQFHPDLKQLSSGRWLILVVREDCDHCGELMVRYFRDPRTHRPGERTALFVAGSDEWPFQFDFISFERSGDRFITWPAGEPSVASPAVFVVEDGTVIQAADGDEADRLTESLLRDAAARTQDQRHGTAHGSGRAPAVRSLSARLSPPDGLRRFATILPVRHRRARALPIRSFLAFLIPAVRCGVSGTEHAGFEVGIGCERAPRGARLLAGSLEIPVCSRVAEIVREKLTGVRVCRYTCESVLSERFVRSKESGCGLPNGVGVVLLHVAAAGSRRSRLDPNSAR